MAVHVPYSQRHRQPPIYIGFDEPPQFQRKPRNWWGFNGLLLSIAGLFTCGFLSPVAFVVSAVGLRRNPRKAAVTGTVLSLVGMGMVAAMIIGGITEEMRKDERRRQARYQRSIAKQVEQTQSLLATAAADLEDYRDENSGQLPEAMDGNLLVIKYVDPWKTELRYEEGVDKAMIRSSGPDKVFDSSDDLFVEITGKTDVEPLLPVDE